MAKINLSSLDKTLTADELQELDAAELKTPVFDEDSPEMTADMLLQFKRMNSTDRKKRKIL